MSTFFKNTELAARYRVSEATVRNWIKIAKSGKVGLELVEYNGRLHVAKAISNIPVVEGLVGKNRKYRNSLAVKSVTPSRDLFRVFNEAQVYDIVRNLELHHEIPRQYSYFGKGVEAWDEYINSQMSVETPSVVRRTIELLEANTSYLDERLAKFKKINVIDIGVGNAVPIKSFLARLIAQKKLGRYVALDFSKDMLDLAKSRLSEWFGGKLQFEGYQMDMASQRFQHLLTKDYLGASDTINVIFMLGSTPNNLRNPSDAFRTVCESMNPKDIFVYTSRTAPLAALPEWFEHEVGQRKPEVTGQHRVVFDLLNIKESFYDVEIGFDEKTNARFARTVFKVAIRITFTFPNGKRIVAFEKGDTITLWRAWQFTANSLAELLQSAGFYVLHSSQSADRSYILTIAEVEADRS